MIQHLTGVTHALVSVPSEAESRRTGVSAVVDLCFGQGNNAISGLRYVRSGGQTSWLPPMTAVEQDGRVIHVPVFRGTVLNEVCKLASQAIARVKKDIGSPEWGKTYIVLKDRVVIQEPEGENQ